jgi:hypothetical protein
MPIPGSPEAPPTLAATPDEDVHTFFKVLDQHLFKAAIILDERAKISNLKKYVSEPLQPWIEELEPRPDIRTTA